MKIKLKVTPKPGVEPREVTTNLLVIAEWERNENIFVEIGFYRYAFLANGP